MLIVLVAVLLAMTLAPPGLARAAVSDLDPGYDWQGIQTDRLNGASYCSLGFGARMVLDGNTLVVAGDYNCVVIFSRPSADSPWSFASQLSLPSQGRVPTLALSGDTLAVGATSASVTTPVLLFARNQGGSEAWGQVDTLDDPDQELYSWFGGSLAISGDVLVVGATGSGSVFVYRRASSNWQLEARLTPSDGSADARFGDALTIDGDSIAVGAPLKRDTNGGSGVVYLYQREAGNNWSEVARRDAASASSVQFGKGLALTNDTLAVSTGLTGQVVIFERNLGGAGAWGTAGVLSVPGEHLGSSIALSSTRLAVGDPTFSDTRYEVGATYIFERDPGQPDRWQLMTRLTANDLTTGAHVGRSVVLDGAQVLSSAKGITYGAVYEHRLALRPTPAADSAVIAEDTSAAIDMLANDSAPASAGALDPGSLVITVPPAHGSATIDPATHWMSYTPAANYNGPDTLTYSVAATNGASRTAIVTLQVQPVNDPPALTSLSTSTATAASPYSAAVAATDIEAGNAVTLTALSLPPWLTLQAGGPGAATLVGTPGSADVGQRVIELAATDTEGLSATRSFTITVRPNTAPTFLSSPSTVALEGSAYSSAIRAYDPDPEQTVTLSAPTLPPWLSFQLLGPGIGRLMGTPGPADVGPSEVRLIITDSGGLEIEQRFTITVAPDAPAPPSGLIVAPAGPSSTWLRWADNSTNELGFRVERRRVGGLWETITELGPGVTSYVDQGLSCGAPYEYQVRAFHSRYASEPSAGRIATPEDLRTLHYEYSGAPQPLGGPGGADLDIIVTDVGPLSDVDVSVAALHPLSGYLRLELVGPDGTVVRLKEGFGGIGRNLEGTIFDDLAAVVVGEAMPPYSGYLRPAGSLTNLVGSRAEGLWRLRVANASPYLGTVTGFGLSVTVGAGCPGVPATPTGSPAPTTVRTATPTSTATPTPVPTQSGPLSTVVDVGYIAGASSGSIEPGAVITAPMDAFVFTTRAEMSILFSLAFLLEEGEQPGFQTADCAQIKPGDRAPYSNFTNIYNLLDGNVRLTRGYYGATRLYDGHYRLIVCDTITGHYPLLDGDGDGLPGGDFVRDFEVRSGRPQPTPTPTNTPTATLTNTPTVTNTPTLTNTPTAIPTALASEFPRLTLNYRSGRPGSAFQLHGEGFEPGARLTLTANGVPFGAITTQKSGAFSLVLTTEPGAMTGRYELAVAGELTQGSAMPEAFVLADGFPLRQVASAELPVLALPVTLSALPTGQVHLPLIVRAP